MPESRSISAASTSAGRLRDYPDDLPRGGIVGSARVASVMRRHPSRWAQRGQWHIVLTDARPRPFRPCRGQLGFFRVEG